jgi:hypothetical protein
MFVKFVSISMIADLISASISLPWVLLFTALVGGIFSALLVYRAYSSKYQNDTEWKSLFESGSLTTPLVEDDSNFAVPKGSGEVFDLINLPQEELVHLKPLLYISTLFFRIITT